MGHLSDGGGWLGKNRNRPTGTEVPLRTTSKYGESTFLASGRRQALLDARWACDYHRLMAPSLRERPVFASGPLFVSGK
jgi:hypothetical protein